MITSSRILPIAAATLLLNACGGGASSSPDTSTNATRGTIPSNSQSSSTADASGNQTSVPPAEQITEEPEVSAEATSFFFSYDESGSTASRDLALTSLANGRKPDPALGRPYEFLNAEALNGFAAISVGPFDVSMGMLRSQDGDIPSSVTTDGSVYGLGVHIKGPTRTLNERRNVVLTVLLDISGSMDASYANETINSATTLLDVAKIGLRSMQQSLKQGDIVNIITFATNADVVLEGHSPTPNSLDSLIDNFATTGSTDIGNGIDLAYQVANRNFDADKANRLILITDANVNTGEIDPDEIARPTTINELEGIYFSGVGVGAFFNDRVLNTVTDAGKGSYSAMITPADARRIFTDGFFRFLNPAASDVKFQLTYPQEMDQLQSFAEEISTEASEVNTINFSYNSSQFFLELFSGPDTLSPDGELRLDITYEQSDGQEQSATISKTVDALQEQGTAEIKAAAAVATLAQLINGSLTCETVLSSRLYNNPVQNEVYQSYKRHVENFCSL